MFTNSYRTVLYLSIVSGLFQIAICKESSSATITFGGDLMLGGYYNSPDYGTMTRLTDKVDSLYLLGGAALVKNELFRNLRPVIEKADYCVANLEGPVTENIPMGSIESKMYPKLIPLRQSQFTPDVLKAVGIDLVSLANNHMFDYNNEEGLTETIKRLENKVEYVGAGIGNNAFNPIVKELNGIRFSIFGVSDIIHPGEMCAKPGKLGIAGIADTSDYENSEWIRLLTDKIAEVRSESDFVIVLIHYGPSSGSKLNERQISITDILLRDGADLIVGSHSHHKQEIKEIRNDRNQISQLVFYGLGNFVFGGKQGAQALSALAIVNFLKNRDEKQMTYRTVEFYPNPDTTFTPVLVNP